MASCLTHQAITWSSVSSLSNDIGGIHTIAILQEVLTNLVPKMCSGVKITPSTPTPRDIDLHTLYFYQVIAFVC